MFQVIERFRTPLWRVLKLPLLHVFTFYYAGEVEESHVFIGSGEAQLCLWPGEVPGGTRWGSHAPL